MDQNDPGRRQFAAGPSAYGAAPPDNQRDAFAARDLGMVAAGHDMRFGPMSPQSMFRGPTVQSAPGQYTVHPMMPSRGGPMPMPAADLGTSQYERNMGAMQWAQQHQSPSEGSVATMLGMRPGGDMAVRLQGFPKQPGNPNGPGYAYAPAGQIAGAFNKLAANNPGLGLSPFNVDGGGVPMSADGRTPMNAADLHSAMVQARRDRGQQKIEMLRDNMRGRLAIRAAQRGNMGPLAKLMQARGDQQAGAAGDGVDHNAVFGLVGEMLKNGGDKLSVNQKSKLLQGLASAMLAGKVGAAQIPGLIGDIGGMIGAAEKRVKVGVNDLGKPIDQNQLAQFKEQFKTPQEFAAFARQSGMSDQVTNKWLHSIYGPNADFGTDNFGFGVFGHKLTIDPNQNYQAVPTGILPGIGDAIYKTMPGLFGRPPSPVGPAPRNPPGASGGR